MVEKIKILFVITKGNFGGAQRYVYDLATNLPTCPPTRQEAAFDIVVACGSASAKASTDKEGDLLIERLKDSNIRTINLENSQRDINLKKDWGAFKELVRVIKEEKPNVVHLNSSKIGLLGALAVLYIRILNLFFFVNRNSLFVPRCIFTAHGWAFNEKNRSRLSRVFFYIAHYFTVLLCDKTIAVSQKTKEDIAWLPFIKNKITVVHNGISKYKLLTKKESREFLGISDKKTLVFSLSELHANKGVDVAIKGISLLPAETKSNILYYVAGAGENKSKLEQLISELGLQEQVKLLGFVEEGKQYLSGSDIFLLPSRTEAFPYSILEAAEAGVPIIATAVGGVPEIINDMRNGILIHPERPKEAAEAITYLLSHPTQKAEFKKEIKKTFLENFSIEKMVEKTRKIYESS